MSEKTASAEKTSLKARALEEMKKYLAITLYLWVLFALFGLYRKVLLQENGIDLWIQSYALVNALVFAKVVLLGEILDIGKGMRKLALIWAVLGKSLLFTALLILFHMAEETVRALIKHLPVAETALSFGGGSWQGVFVYSALMFVTLVPVIAFREVADAVGKNTLWKLLLSHERDPARWRTDTAG